MARWSRPWTVKTVRIRIAVSLACPICQSRNLRRSPRRGLGEHILGLLVLPYRCKGCSLRFFRPKWAGMAQLRPSP